MKRKRKKLLALVTALSLVMSLLGVTASAEEGDTSIHPHNQIDCAACNGAGQVDGEDETCTACGGVVLDPVPTKKCSKCRGTGQYFSYGDTCPSCNGENSTPEGCGYPGCSFGYVNAGYRDCPTCNATGLIEDTSQLCPVCNNTGITKRKVDCPACNATGKVDCTGSFDSGVLTAVDSDSGKGTMTYTCATCGASYTEPLSAEDTLQLVVFNVKVEFTAPAFAQVGKSLTYSVKVTNENQVAAKGLAITLKFSDTVTDVSVKKVASSDFDADTHILTMSLDLFGSAQASVGPNSKTITVAAKTVSGEGEDQTVTAAPGDQVTADWTVAYQGKTVDSGSAVTIVSKYPQIKQVTLAGVNLGYRYYTNAQGPDKMNILLPVNGLSCPFDALENQVFAFDAALGADNGFKLNFPFAQDGSVQNCKTDRTWICVGFVPYPFASGYTDLDVLKSYAFSKTGEDGLNTGTLEDAQNFVVQSGGVRYGQTAATEQIDGFVKTLGKSDSFVLMTVWYLPGMAGFELRDGYDLTIPSVTAAYLPTSQGVTIVPDLDGVHAVDGRPHTFEGALTIAIDSAAPDKINVNLSDALAALMDRMSHLDHNAIEPGDMMNFHVKLVNNSGKDFKYVANSAFAATVDRYQGGQSLGTGFDGYTIAASIPDGGADFCAIPRRVANDALAFLGADRDHLSDEAIGALLKEMGYGAGEDLTDAEITQQYLAHFYLDYLNSQRAEGAELAHSFLDLTPAEFARLTNYGNEGGYLGVPETCPTVAQAFYYFYYGVNFTVNGVSIYDQMKDHTAMNKLVADALSGDGTYTLTGQIAGETANNAFQNTAFGFGMQFGMEYTADPGPGPGGRDDRDDDPNPPTPVDIPDDPIPLDPGPGEDVPPQQPIPDEDIPTTDPPQTEIPRTGDTALLWLALSGLAGAGLAVLTLPDRKKKRD